LTFLKYNKVIIIRIFALLTTLIGLYLVILNNGFLEHADPHKIKNIIIESGSYGIALYIALFAIGLLVYVPGMLFLISSGLIYGPFWGSLIALLGACIAVNISFVIVRLIGGRPIKSIKNKHAQKLLDGLHKNPVKHIAVLRTVMITAPGFNYLLALSDVSFKQYFWGSLLGMIIPVFAVIYFTDIVLKLFF